MAYESDIYWTRRQADLVEAIDSLVIPHRVAGDDDSAAVISPTDSDYSPLGSIISMARGYGALMRRSSSKYSTESASSCYSTDGGYGSIRSRSRSTHRRAYGGREALPAPPKIIINDGIFGGDTLSSPSAAISSSPYYDSQFYPSNLSHYSPVPIVDQDARTISSNASAVRDSVYSNRHSRGDSYSSNSSDEEPFAGTRLSRSPTRRIISDNSYGPTRTLSRSRQPRSNLLPQRRGAIQRRNRPANATPRWSTIEATAADPEPVQASRGLRRKYSWEA